MDKLQRRIGRRQFLGNGAKLAVAASILAGANKDREAEAATAETGAGKKW